MHRHMLEHREDTREEKQPTARDNRSYCCRENFVGRATGMTLESFNGDCEREDESVMIISISRSPRSVPLATVAESLRRKTVTRKKKPD